MLTPLAKIALPSASTRNDDLRYRLPPLAADTNEPIRPTAAGASNSTGAWQVAILRAPRRASARRPAYSPSASGLATLSATRAELYQSSRCIRPRSSAITESDSVWREAGKPCMNPRLLANTNCECCADTLAPSELLIFGDSANAARSVRRARRIASSVPRSHG